MKSNIFLTNIRKQKSVYFICFFFFLIFLLVLCKVLLNFLFGFQVLKTQDIQSITMYFHCIHNSIYKNIFSAITLPIIRYFPLLKTFYIYLNLIFSINLPIMPQIRRFIHLYRRNDMTSLISCHLLINIDFCLLLSHTVG